MNFPIEREQLLPILPHGSDIVGIERVVAVGAFNVEAEAVVGRVACMVVNGLLIPEAVVELVAQAAALGNALSRSSSTRVQGVIAKVRSLKVGTGSCKAGDALIVRARWGEVVLGAFEVSGDVECRHNESFSATIEMTVVQVQ